MCIILLALEQHPRYPLVLLANRDEFYERPSQPMHRWPSGIIAGKDLEGGGTWMALMGQFLALVTNYRDPNQPLGTRSRGRLVLDYFVAPPSKFPHYLRSEGSNYTGYNLLFGRATELFYHSNRNGDIQKLEPGFHGLSNAMLNTPWPKVERGKRLLREVLQEEFEVEQLFAILRDSHRPTDAELPRTGVTLEQERVLSSIYIEAPGYGSRCATVLLMDRKGEVRVWERDYLSGTTVSFSESPEETAHRESGPGTEE